MMVLENKYNIGDFVYLTTDTEQKKWVVTRLSVGSSEIVYELSLGGEISGHYDFEISTEKDIVMKSTSWW